MLRRVICQILYQANNPLILKVIYCMNQLCCQEETPTSALTCLRLSVMQLYLLEGCCNVTLLFSPLQTRDG